MYVHILYTHTYTNTQLNHELKCIHYLDVFIKKFKSILIKDLFNPEEKFLNNLKLVFVIVGFVLKDMELWALKLLWNIMLKHWIICNQIINSSKKSHIFFLVEILVLSAEIIGSSEGRHHPSTSLMTSHLARVTWLLDWKSPVLWYFTLKSPGLHETHLEIFLSFFFLTLSQSWVYPAANKLNLQDPSFD